MSSKPVLFEVYKKHFNLQGPDGKRVPFNEAGLLRTDDPELIAFLDKESAVHRAQDQDKSVEPPKKPGTDTALRAQQLREFLRTSKTGEGSEITDGKKATGLVATASSASPLTGGTNPASPRYTQAETIAAMKGVRVIKDGK